MTDRPSSADFLTAGFDMDKGWIGSVKEVRWRTDQIHSAEVSARRAEIQLRRQERARRIRPSPNP